MLSHMWCVTCEINFIWLFVVLCDVASNEHAVSTHQIEPQTSLSLLNFTNGGSTTASISYNLSKTKKPTMRIVVEYPVKIKDFPYMASLWITKNQIKDDFVCGATIIGETWVLTTANCATAVKSWNAENMSHVRSNSDSLNENYEKHHVTKFYIHEKYDHTIKFDYDISLVKVQQKFKAGWETPIGISANPIDKLEDEAEGIILGWDLTNSNESHANQYLKGVRVSVVDWNTCGRILNETHATVSECTFCVRNPGKDFCMFDSRGSFVYKNKLIGIVSWNFDQCNSTDLAVAYTDVVKLQNWIKAIVKPHNFEMPWEKTLNLSFSNVTDNKVAMNYSEHPVHLMGIIGGHRTSIKRYSFVASIWVKKNNDSLFVCGASILQRQWALTAAHCIDTIYNWNSSDKCYIRSNSTTWKKNYAVHKVIQISVHKNYDPDSSDYDVAVLKVKEPFNRKYEKPIKMSKVRTRKFNCRYIAQAFGWGYTNMKKPDIAKCLRRVHLPMVRWQRCVNIWRGYYQTISTRMICALGYRKDTCNFDDGGPLVYKNKLIGIVSFGVPAICTDPEIPRVYTNVVALREWINFVMNIN